MRVLPLPLSLVLTAEANRWTSTVHTSSTARYDAFRKRSGWLPSSSRRSRSALVLFPRGGDAGVASPEAPSTTTATCGDGQSLDDRVNAAMLRLGLGSEGAAAADVVSEESTQTTALERGVTCQDGVCTIDKLDDMSSSTETSAVATSNTDTGDDITNNNEEGEEEQDLDQIATKIATEMNVPNDIVMAAIYSSFSGAGDNRRIDEKTARMIVQAEVDAISNVAEDCEEVQQLVSEGFDTFFSRRSLAFADMNVDDARAILIADQEDEDAERMEMEAAQAAAAVKKEEPELKTVTVEYPKDFNPLVAAAPQPAAPKRQEAPKPAKKEDVVFEGTVEDLQKLVIESPVPVLLDVCEFTRCLCCCTSPPICANPIASSCSRCRLVWTVQTIDSCSRTNMRQCRGYAPPCEDQHRPTASNLSSVGSTIVAYSVWNQGWKGYEYVSGNASR